MVNLTLRDVYRASDVMRWQIVKTQKQQSLADHSYQVAMISLRLCYLMQKDDRFRAACLEYALVHDLPEVLTGDMATPLKQLLAVEGALERFESSVHFNDQSVNGFSREVRDLVKLADLLEAYAHLDLNSASGHGGHVKDKIASKIDAKIDEIAPDVGHTVMVELTVGPFSTLDEIIEDQDG